MASKVFLKQLSQEVIDFIMNNSGSGGGDASLQEEIISNITVGGAPSGTVFQKYQSFTDFAKNILLTSIVPKISTSVSNAGIKEMGDSVSNSILTLKIDNLPQVTVDINEINFYVGNTKIKTLPFVDGQNTYTTTYSTAIKTTTTCKIKLVYDTNKVVSGSGTYTFVYPTYFGTTQLAVIDSSAAQTLISSFNKSLKTNKSATYNGVNLNDTRFCYMYPASYGNLSDIKDGNGFSQLTGYTKSTVTITHPKDGKNVSYNVYLLTDAATGSNFTQIYS